jgi:hypothetical protein
VKSLKEARAEKDFPRKAYTTLGGAAVEILSSNLPVIAFIGEELYFLQAFFGKKTGNSKPPARTRFWKWSESSPAPAPSRHGQNFGDKNCRPDSISQERNRGQQLRPNPKIQHYSLATKRYF